MLRHLPLILLLVAAPALAQAPPAPLPQHIPAPGGEVILVSPNDQAAYEKYQYAAVRRVGDTLFLSGVVVGANEPIDRAEFERRLRILFPRIEAKLKAAGASFADVDMLHTYHVWKSPQFKGGKDEQQAAFEAVKAEFFKAPYPAWTAVGVESLYGDAGLVEIEITAHVPVGGATR